MNRNQLNYAIDVLLALLGLAVLVTGLLLAFVVPRGSGRRGLELWGLARHDWSDVHLYLALAMTAAVVVHVLLHWTWVHGTTARLLGRRSDPRGRGRWVSMAVVLVALAAVVAGSLLVGRTALG